MHETPVLAQDHDDDDVSRAPREGGRRRGSNAASSPPRVRFQGPEKPPPRDREMRARERVRSSAEDAEDEDQVGRVAQRS